MFDKLYESYKDTVHMNIKDRLTWLPEGHSLGNRLASRYMRRHGFKFFIDRNQTEVWFREMNRKCYLEVHQDQVGKDVFSIAYLNAGGCRVVIAPSLSLENCANVCIQLIKPLNDSITNYKN